MIPLGGNPRFRCPRPADFALRSWPDGVAVFDDRGGHIRALSPLAGEILRLLQSSADGMDVMAIVEALLGVTPEPDDAASMLALLGEFELLGFAEREVE